MAKFSGVIGYGHAVRTAPGVTNDVITEKKAFGDVIQNSRRLQESDQSTNDDIAVGNSISIVADAYASENFYAIRYVEWAGALWKVSNVDVNRPRLILRLGGVYNGPRAAQQGEAPVAP